MAFAFGAAGTVSSGSGTSATTTAPAGGSTGDLLRLTVFSTSSSTVSTPSGWALEGTTSIWFGSGRITTFYRDKGNATGSDTPTLTVSSGNWLTQIVRYTGWDGAAPDDIAAAEATADPFTVDDVGCTVDGSMAMTSFATYLTTSRSVTSYPTGYAVINGSTANCFHTGYLAVDSGAVGGGSWDCSGGIRLGWVIAVYNPGAAEIEVALTASEALATSEAMVVTEEGPPTIALAPIADVSDGAWLNESANGTDLFASIDEETPSDSDYIQSSLTTGDDVCELLLDDPGGVPDAGIITLRVRFGAV